MFTLHPFQSAALAALNSPQIPVNHVICVAPTGSGKSLIYENSAAIPQRKMLLISPLVALARQQHQRLAQLGIPVKLGAGGKAEDPPRGKSGSWIISPEMLKYSKWTNALQKWKPNFLVVDECHCLWEWGDAFRPSFNHVPSLIENLTISKSLWLTATLPYDARCALKNCLPKQVTEIGNFSLPENLRLSIKKTPWAERPRVALQWILNRRRDVIIFVATRQATLKVANLIRATGLSAVTYHAGMSSEERKNLEVLISKRIPDVVVATSAFGMGMDYSHLTHVLLWQAPTSILSLVQAIGRVGRQRLKKSEALVLWDFDDFRLLEWAVINSTRRHNDLKVLLALFCSNSCRRSDLALYFDRCSIQKRCHACDTCDNSNSPY